MFVYPLFIAKWFDEKLQKLVYLLDLGKYFNLKNIFVPCKKKSKWTHMKRESESINNNLCETILLRNVTNCTGFLIFDLKDVNYLSYKILYIREQQNFLRLKKLIIFISLIEPSDKFIHFF